MSLMELLRFGWQVIRHPRQWRFIDEGFGISARHRRAKRYWEPHLNLSQSFILRALNELNPTSITVLGSGQLLDFPAIDRLPGSVEALHLVDGNPSNNELYQRLKRESLERNIELTWTVCDVFDIPDEELADEVVVSLNMISQLALMSPKHNYPAARHLAQLGEIARTAAILIGDQSWLTYTPNESLWNEEPACPDVRRWEIPGMNQVAHDQWLWHVAPYGIEQSQYGLIHDVHARLFLRGPTNAEKFS